MRNDKVTFRCAVYMGEEGINVYSNSTRISDLLRHGSFIPFIPEWQVEQCAARNAPVLKCIFGGRCVVKVRESGRFFVSGRFDDLAKAHTIPYLIHYALEAERAKKGKLTIHAAAVSKNGKGILILGKQGSGKTSITLGLCRKYGYSLVGNDLVLAGVKGNFGYLYGGTKIFRLRAATVKHYNRGLKVFFESGENCDEWTHTAVVNPEKIQVTAEKSVVPIQAVYYVHLYPPDHSFLAKEIDQLFSRVYLYQIFSEYIRGSAIIPLVGKDLKFSNYLPSLDNETAFKKRIKFINWIISNDNYKYIAGTLADICIFIDRHLQSHTKLR
ncbi:MAG: hypothetical protein ABH814_01560 [bacterium]